MPPPKLLDINQAAVYLTKRGIRTSPSALRNWRKTWPTGERKGPVPLLLHPRCLRYDPEDCDTFIADYFERARRAATGEAATG